MTRTEKFTSYRRAITILLLGGLAWWLADTLNVFDQLTARPLLIRPFAWTAALGLMALVGLSLYRRAYWLPWRQLTWRDIWPLFDWTLVYIELGVLGAALALSLAPVEWELPVQVKAQDAVTLIIPLLSGVHASLLFSPEDDPVLELMLTYPKTLVAVFVERLTLIFSVNLAIGFTAQIIVCLIEGDPGLMFYPVHWIPPTLLLMGIGLSFSAFSRQPAFGMVSVLMIWFGTGVLNPIFLDYAPFLWNIHPFLAHDWGELTDIALNRLSVTLVALLALFYALTLISNEEYVLTGSISQRKSS